MLLARIRNVVRGAIRGWIARRERRSPEAVYETAIQERIDAYGKLRAAAAGVLYMRTKLATQRDAATAELATVRRQLDVAVEHDDDAAALALIARRDLLDAESTRLTGELAELTEEADAAKKNLVAFQHEIVRLRDEKVHMLARLANAQARLRLQSTLSGLSPDADIRALDEVRDYINQVVGETRLAREVEDGELARRLERIREAESEATARAQLAELKRARQANLVPVVLPDPVEVRARRPVDAAAEARA
jgi:phage shock protein A